MTDDIAKLLGRVLIALFFIWMFADMAMAPSGAMEKIKGLGLPYPGVAYAIILVMLGFSSLGVLLGYKARMSAMALLVGWGAVIIFFYLDFSSKGHIFALLDRAAIFGGILYIYASGPGRYHIRI